MFSEKLFENILLDPAKKGCDTLLIASGYASANMVSRHFEELSKIKKLIRIKLIIGMCFKDGIAINNHLAFKQLTSEIYPTNFECSYFTKRPPLHAKIYVWLKNKIPTCSFIGSANYTQNAFSNQRELMTNSHLIKSYEYFKSLVKDSIDCRDEHVGAIIPILDEPFYKMVRKLTHQETNLVDIKNNTNSLPDLDHITISFLDRKGDLPQTSGLNWGQRKGREKNQAYIHIPSSIYKTNFFPDRKIHFTILTDDGKALIFSRAQDNGKALHTPHNNSLMGEYFRNRLGLASGARVLLDDLVKYGRTDVDFYKIDNETYYMDFSVKK